MILRRKVLAVFGFSFYCDVLCAFENIAISSELAGHSLLTRCVRGAWSLEECDSCLLFSHT